MDAVTIPADPDPTTGPTLVFEAKTQDHSVAEDILGILTGTFLVSLGLHLLHAAGAVTGGTAGLSLLLGYATGWPFWILFAAVNLPFALLAVWRRGWDFTIRTIVCIALVSGLAPLHDALFPISGLQPLYGTLAGNLLAGVGVLILFRHRGSVGGINIVGLEIQDRTGFRAGWTMMIFDVLIVALALLVVPWPNVVMSAVGAILLNLVLALNHRRAATSAADTAASPVAAGPACAAWLVARAAPDAESGNGCGGADAAASDSVALIRFCCGALAGADVVAVPPGWRRGASGRGQLWQRGHQNTMRSLVCVAPSSVRRIGVPQRRHGLRSRR